MTTIRFFELVPDRECGECDVCCHVLEIDHPELKKPADTYCPHRSQNSGCEIYESRPSVCQNWYCSWREIPELPDTCRPDRLGIVFTLERNPDATVPEGHLYILGRTINDETAYNLPLARRVFEMFMQQTPLWLVVDNERVEYGGPNKPINPRFLQPKQNPWDQVGNYQKWAKKP